MMHPTWQEIRGDLLEALAEQYQDAADDLDRDAIQLAKENGEQWTVSTVHELFAISSDVTLFDPKTGELLSSNKMWDAVDSPGAAVIRAADAARHLEWCLREVRRLGAWLP